MPDLSIIILTHNTRELLKAAVLSIKERTNEISFETIVVDNASSDGTKEMIKSDFPDIQYIFNEKNLGFTRGNNIGIEASHGQYVLLLNSDTEVLDGALDKLVDFMNRHPECGVTGPMLLNTDGSLQYSCRRFPSYHTALFNRYSIMTKLFPQNRFSQDYLMSSIDHRETMEVDWVSGAALMVRRKAFEETGLLDERFVSYSEDVDWCYRMHEAGWKVYFFPEAKIMHHIGQSARKHPYLYILIRHQSMYKFYRKHYSRSIKSIDYMVFGGVAVRCLWNMFQAAFGQLFQRKEPKT